MLSGLERLAMFSPHVMALGYKMLHTGLWNILKLVSSRGTASTQLVGILAKIQLK